MSGDEHKEDGCCKKFDDASHGDCGRKHDHKHGHKHDHDHGKSCPAKKECCKPPKPDND